MRLRPSLLPVVLALAACTEYTTGDPCPAGGSCIAPQLRVINGAGGPVEVRFDGVVVAGAAATGSVSSGAVGLGSHSVQVRRTGSVVMVNRTLTVSGTSATLVVVDSQGSTLSLASLSDTGAVVPAGHTKLRVAHFATDAPPLDVWRSQPDYPTMIRLVFPFSYRFESAYVQSTPGTWRVIISTATDPYTVNAPPDTLADSGPILIGDGLRRDVIVTNKAGGGFQVVVVEP